MHTLKLRGQPRALSFDIFERAVNFPVECRLVRKECVIARREIVTVVTVEAKPINIIGLSWRRDMANVPAAFASVSQAAMNFDFYIVVSFAVGDVARRYSNVAAPISAVATAVREAWQARRRIFPFLAVGLSLPRTWTPNGFVDFVFDQHFATAR